MRIRYGKEDGITLYRLVPLTPAIDLSWFSCPFDEYNDYLNKDALRSQNDHIENSVAATIAPPNIPMLR